MSLVTSDFHCIVLGYFSNFLVCAKNIICIFIFSPGCMNFLKLKCHSRFAC